MATKAPVEQPVEEDSHKGEMGPSFLDVATKHVGPKKALTSRVCYVAEIAAGTSAEKNAGHMKSLFGRVTDKVNGIALVHSDSLIGLIESTPTGVMGVMRELEKASGPLSGIRVVCSVEDCPSVLFSTWSSKAVSIPAEAGVTLDDLVYTSCNVYNMMMNIAKNAIDVENATNLPSQEVVVAICRSQDVQSLGEFLELYDAPINVSLEHSLVWPLQPFVQY
jgi:hypothetical protein